jgi:hypothetical protein
MILMKHIQNKKVLVIADVHQCLGYVNRVLELEQDWEHIVLLGDYFDCQEPPDNINYFTVYNTCAWINQKYHEWGEHATWLTGNHDVALLATFTKSRYSPPKNTFYYCSGYTRSKAHDFNRVIDENWVKNLELCCRVGDYYLSHAGFQYEHFIPYISVEDNIDRLYNKWEQDKGSFYHYPYHWIWDVGTCRGGNAAKGSVVWCDWRHEFCPIPEIKQIVGHTSSIKKEIREKDGNYCIDNYRQTYAVIRADGKLEIKHI